LPSSSTLKLSGKQIRTLCRRRLIALGASLPLLDHVARVVQNNLISGRFDRFACGQRDHRAVPLTAYVDGVIFHTSREYARVQRLERGDAAEWNRLRDLLAHRAGGMMRSLRVGVEVEAEALDFAQQACLIIFGKPYPFDVAFDAWATTILKHLIQP
jgi:hypothetical protein